MSKDIIYRQLPPRSVSPFTQAVVLNSGHLMQYGWIWLVIGTVIFWLIALNSIAVDWASQHERTATTSGIIQKTDKLHHLEDEIYLYRNYADFSVKNKSFTAISYTNGKTHEKGNRISIKYNPKHPTDAVIKGERSKRLEGSLLWMGIIPLLALVFIYDGIKKNRKSLDLLKNGHFTTGRMIYRKKTKAAINVNGKSRLVYAYKFEYKVENNYYTISCRTHQTELLEDTEKEIILYRFSKEKKSIIYDMIKNAPKFDQEGLMMPLPIKNAKYLVAPTLAILLNLTFLLVLLF